MSNLPLSYLPGVCKVDTAYLDSVKGGGNNGKNVVGRFTDMQWMRMVAGQPEKIIPFAADIQNFAFNPLGIRRLQDWRDNNAMVRLALGCDTTLQYLSGTSVDGTTTDITPLRYITTGTLTNPFTTTNASNFVTVTATNNFLVTNDWVRLTGTAAVGGLTIAGNYSVVGTGGGSFVINAVSTATANTTSVGGVVTYGFPKVQLSNPFVTLTGTNLVTVLHTAHGAGAGDMVYWTGGTAFNGVPTAGTTTINSILGTNSYNIVINGTGATGSGTGGGTPIFAYGITFQSLTNFNAPGMWTISPYGQQLIATVPGAGVYVYDPAYNGRAYPLYNAPTSGVFAAFVTPERFVFILGNTSALIPTLTVLWPDQSNYTNFTPLPNNTANSGRVLQDGSFLVSGIAVRDGVSLVFTNTTVYQFQYTGDNNVYASTLAGKSCGLIGPAAMAVMNNIAYWFSGDEMWMWNGTTQKMQWDDIRDYVVKDLDKANAYKCVVGTSVKRNEVWLLYPSITDGLGENSRYAIFHIDQNCQSTGSTDTKNIPPLNGFSSWIDKNLYGCPLIGQYTPGGPLSFTSRMNDVIGNVNSSYDQASLTFSPVDISKGDKNVDLFAFYPDFLFQNTPGSVNINIITQDYPPAVSGTSGPYAFADTDGKVDLRLGAKLMGFQIEDVGQATTTLWRLGLPRIEIQPAGARR